MKALDPRDAAWKRRRREEEEQQQAGHVKSMCALSGVVVAFRRRGSARACMRACTMAGGPRHALCPRVASRPGTASMSSATPIEGLIGTK